MLECQSGTDVAHAGAPNVARTGCAGRYGIWISVHVTMHAKPNSSRTIIPAEVLVAKRQQRKTEKRQAKVDRLARMLADAMEGYVSTGDDRLLPVMREGVELLVEMRCS